MTPPLQKFLGPIILLCLLTARTLLAEAIEFGEVSLLVRARESEASIIREVSQRKLVRPLTPQQEGTLKTHGATDSLLQNLRRSGLVLSQAEAASFDARREQARKETQTPRSNPTAEDSSARDDVHIFEISVGHPINLSQWGGPDYEFAFHAKTRLDEGRPDVVMVDNVRSYTHAATYLGGGRAEDSTTIFDHRNYVSVMDHSFTRGLRIDRRNPVSIKGVPYTLYPVYAAGGVSLYYIGGSSDSVKLAVSTAGR